MCASIVYYYFGKCHFQACIFAAALNSKIKAFCDNVRATNLWNFGNLSLLRHMWWWHVSNVFSNRMTLEFGVCNNALEKVEKLPYVQIFIYQRMTTSQIYLKNTQSGSSGLRGREFKWGWVGDEGVWLWMGCSCWTRNRSRFRDRRKLEKRCKIVGADLGGSTPLPRLTDLMDWMVLAANDPADFLIGDLNGEFVVEHVLGGGGLVDGGGKLACLGNQGQHWTSVDIRRSLRLGGTVLMTSFDAPFLKIWGRFLRSTLSYMWSPSSSSLLAAAMMATGVPIDDVVIDVVVVGDGLIKPVVVGDEMGGVVCEACLLFVWFCLPITRLVDCNNCWCCGCCWGGFGGLVGGRRMTGVLTCLGRDPRLLRGGGAISIISSEPERWLSL